MTNGGMTYDPLLQVLVELANSGDVAIPVTLNVGGMAISGNLVSGQAYFNGVAEEVGGGGADEAHEALKKELSAAGERIYGAGGGDSGAPQFVHVKTSSGYWRGRVQAVDGYTLGR